MNSCWVVRRSRNWTMQFGESEGEELFWNESFFFFFLHVTVVSKEAANSHSFCIVLQWKHTCSGRPQWFSDYKKPWGNWKWGRHVYLYLLSVFCSLGVWVGSCSPSTTKGEKQSREGGSHEAAEQEFYFYKTLQKLVWHYLLTGDFACKIIRIHLNLRNLQMKDWNSWIIWYHGFMTRSPCAQVHKMMFE